LFVALWPPEPVREAIARWQSAWVWPRYAAPVPAERLHITLQFLGNVPVLRLADLRSAIHVQSPPFALALGRPQVWGNGVAVARPQDMPMLLRSLQARLVNRLHEAGFVVEERPYRAHVTLARKAAHATAPQQALSVEWPVNDHVLVRSLPGGRGYEVIERFDWHSAAR
jgi:2'-5' RNA ligase